MKSILNRLLLSFGLASVVAPAAFAQEVSPFPPTPSASTPGLTMQASTYRGEIATPTLDRRRTATVLGPGGITKLVAGAR